MCKIPVLVSILSLILVTIGCGPPTSPEKEYILTVDGYGAMYIGSGTTGKIDGHDYLFVNLNTEGSEPHVIPGILVLDVENPARPKEIGYLQAPEDMLYISSLAFYGTTLYVCSSDYLWMVDVSEPAHPEGISNYAYVNDGNRQITVVDVTDPVNLRIVGSFQLESLSGISLGVHDSVLYAKTSQELHIIDISHPSAPREVDTFTATFENIAGTELAFHLRQFTLSGDYACVILAAEEQEEAIAVLDLSEPTAPRELSRIKPETDLFGANLFVSGDRMFLYTRDIGHITSQHRDNLYVYDLSVPDRPELLNSHRYKEPQEYLAEPIDGFFFGANWVNGYLYRFIGNAPNAPFIITNKLPDY
jgi:hypothetical protein